MDAKTAEALEKSIEHWRENECVTNKHDACVTADECALCGVFVNEENEHMSTCAGCPVSTHVGRSDCFGSPWEEAYKRRYKGKFSLAEFREAAKAEREFLESLREPVDS
jgi:hypothetical protein